MPRKANAGVQSLDWTAYSKDVLLNFTDMVRTIPDMTRVGVAEKQVVARTYLPMKAAHNLALSTYLCLLENSKIAGAGGAVAMASAAPSQPQTIPEKLQKKITLAFPRNTLEMSMKMMADEIGVPITIIGGDLQLEGITKNQSFGLDEKDKPAVEIFAKILKQANPDGKLIYIFKPGESGSEEIFLTTRAAADKRGDKVPPELAAAPAKKK